MFKIIFLIIIICITFFYSCGEEPAEQVTKKSDKKTQTVPDQAEIARKRMAKFEEKWQKRHQSNDTAAINPKKFLEFIIHEIPGFSEPQVDTMTTVAAGSTGSIANASYQSDEGAIKIRIYDYNANFGSLSSMTMWIGGYSIENNERLERTFDTGVENVFGMERFEKEKFAGELMYLIDYRFLLYVQGFGFPDNKKIEEVANMIDLKKIRDLDN